MASRTRRGKQGTHRWVTPLQYANLSIWYDAGRITGLNNNDAVTTWSDLSTNANDASQATAAKKPLYLTNQRNGLPAVDFDGTNDQLDTGAVLPGGSAAYMLLVVEKADVTAASRGWFGYGTYGTANAVIAWRLAVAGTGNYQYWWANDLPGTTDPGTTWRVLTAYFDGSTRASVIDGTTDVSDSPTGKATASTVANLGVTNVSEYFDGKVAELCFFAGSGVANPAIRRRLERSLGRKYAITA